MNTKQNIFIVITVLFLGINSSKADYRTSIGARFGKVMSDIEIKHFYNNNRYMGMEFKVGVTQEAYGGYKAKAFYIFQHPIFDSRLQIPVDFIYGAGLHAGYFKEKYYRIVDGSPSYYQPKTMTAGADAKFELEYSTRKFPVTVSVDCNVFYSFYNPGPEWLDFGLTLRYKL